MRDYSNSISVSVLKNAFESGCKRSPVIKHIIQEKTAKMHKNTGNFHNPTKGETFHEKYFTIFNKGLRKRAGYDSVASVLLDLKTRSIYSSISPVILSESFHITGTPDFYLEAAESAMVVELKNRHSSTFSNSDVIQVGAYVTILKDPWFRSTPALYCRGKGIDGYILFNDGALKEVEFNDEDLIRSKALEILGNVDEFQINKRLSKPEKCSPYCESIVYCNQIDGVISYENTAAGPGGIEVQSLADSRRA